MTKPTSLNALEASRTAGEASCESHTTPEVQAELDMHSIRDSMQWSNVSDREIEGRRVTVKTATPSAEFWSAWRSSKETMREAGLFASKDDKGVWIVEWIADCTEGSVSTPKGEDVVGPAPEKALDRVANLPPGPIADSSTATATIEMVSPEFFSPNPHSTDLYSQVVSPALLESVANEGVKVPVRALRTGKLIDGWQRVEAAKESGWKLVPTIFMEVRPEAEIYTILLYNSQRIKSIPDRLREFRAYLQIERDKAPERVGIRTDLDQGLPEGHTQFGKSHELAAKKVALSGTSAKNGLRVLEEIERRNGSDAAAEALKILTEQGINPAWKFAYSHGWIDASVKPRKRKASKNGDVETQANGANLDDESAPRSEGTAETDLPVAGWMTDELIEDVIAAVAPTDPEGADALRKTISDLRPYIYALAGTTPAASDAPKLRATAKAIEGLADSYAQLAGAEEPKSTEQQ